MAFATSGTFSRLWEFLTERVNNQKIFLARLDGELDGIATGLSNVAVWMRPVPERFNIADGTQLLDDITAFLMTENVDDRGDRFMNGERRRIREVYKTTSSPVPFRHIVWEHTNATALSKAGTAIVGMYRITGEGKYLEAAQSMADKVLALQWRNPGTARNGGIRLSEKAGQASAFTAGIAGDFLLKLYDVTGQPQYIQAAIRVGGFLKVLNDPNTTYFSLYGETPIPEPTRNGYTWNGFCDQIDAGDIISITCTTWNLVAVPFLQRLADRTGDTSYDTVATAALGFVDTGAVQVYDFFAIYNNAPSARVSTAWPVSPGYGFVADHQWHRQGEETGIGGTAVHSGTAAAGAASSITLDAAASSTDDAYNGKTVQLLSGTGSGQTRVITDYVGSTKVATVGRAWDTAPDSTTTFEIEIAANTVGTDQVEYGLSSMLEAGVSTATMTTHYEAIKAYPHIDGTSTSFATAYDPEYSWTGYIRMRIDGDGGPAFFGSYYDAQGTLIYLKSQVDSGAVAKAVTIAGHVVDNGALLIEDFTPFWSTGHGGKFFTKGTIPVAVPAVDILKVMGAYD